MYGRKADGNILILALDLACVAASLGIGFGARYGRLYGVWAHWDMVWMLVLFLVAYTALALLLDFHRHFFRRGAVDELRQVLKGQLLLCLTMLAILYAMHRSDDLSRAVAACFLVSDTALTLLARLLFRQAMLKGYRRSRYSSRLLLVAGIRAYRYSLIFKKTEKIPERGHISPDAGNLKMRKSGTYIIPDIFSCYFRPVIQTVTHAVKKPMISLFLLNGT